MVGRGLGRQRPTRQAKPKLLVVCEGNTERIYLEALNAKQGHPVVLEIVADHSSPREIVRLAAGRKRAARKMAHRDPDEALGGVWCFFDHDEHPFIPEAINQAEDNEIHLAFSNPCFELWLLLHFQNQTAALERQTAASLYRNHDVNYGKSPAVGPLMERVDDAVARARLLVQRQTENGNVRENPWTTVQEFVLALQQRVSPAN